MARESTQTPPFDYDNADEEKNGELLPTLLPYACLPHYRTGSYNYNVNRPLNNNYGETDSAITSAHRNAYGNNIVAADLPKALTDVQYLYENGIIHWPNFTILTTGFGEDVSFGNGTVVAGETASVDYCLPNCGLCTTHTGDSNYFVFNLLVIGTLLPLVGLCGIVGNSLSAYIYSRPSLRTQSANLYLCALGCSDNAVILTAQFLFFIDNIKRHSATLSVVYGRLSPVIYPAGMIAQTCSVYFTLIAGIDCFVKVCLNSELQRFFASQRFAGYAIGATLVFSILYNVPHGFEAILVDCWHVQFHSRSVEVCPTPLRFNQIYTTIYYKYMYSIFLAVGPLLLLILLNSCIIIVTVYSKKHRKHLCAVHNYPQQIYVASRQSDSMNCPGKTLQNHNVNNGNTANYSGVNMSAQLYYDNDRNMQKTRLNSRRGSYGKNREKLGPDAGNTRTSKSILKVPNSSDIGADAESTVRPLNMMFNKSIEDTSSIMRPTHRCVSFNENPSEAEADDNMALILVVLLFIACNTVALLINVFETRLSTLLEWRINYIIDVSNLLVVFNSSFNIVIYYNFSCTYRNTFRAEFLEPLRFQYRTRDTSAVRQCNELANKNSRTELLDASSDLLGCGNNPVVQTSLSSASSRDTFGAGANMIIREAESDRIPPPLPLPYCNKIEQINQEIIDRLKGKFIPRRELQLDLNDINQPARNDIDQPVIDDINHPMIILRMDYNNATVIQNKAQIQNADRNYMRNDEENSAKFGRSESRLRYETNSIIYIDSDRFISSPRSDLTSCAKNAGEINEFEPMNNESTGAIWHLKSDC